MRRNRQADRVIEEIRKLKFVLNPQEFLEVWNLLTTFADEYKKRTGKSPKCSAEQTSGSCCIKASEIIMDLIGAIATMGVIVVVLWIGTAIYLRIKEGY